MVMYMSTCIRIHRCINFAMIYVITCFLKVLSFMLLSNNNNFSIREHSPLTDWWRVTRYQRWQIIKDNRWRLSPNEFRSLWWEIVHTTASQIITKARSACTNESCLTWLYQKFYPSLATYNQNKSPNHRNSYFQLYNNVYTPWNKI